MIEFFPPFPAVLQGCSAAASKPRPAPSVRPSRLPAYWLTPASGKPYKAAEGAVYIRMVDGGPIRRLSNKPIRSRRQMLKAMRREQVCRNLEQKFKA